MVLGGLWHGAAWNYVWWGIYHGALLCIHRILTSYSWFQVPRAIAWFSMFHLTLFGWMLFRSTRTEWVDDRLVDKSGEQLFQLLATPSNGWYSSDSALLLASTMLFAVPMIFVEWLSTRRQQGLTALSTNPILGPLLLGALGFLVFRWGVQNSGAFIYFQF